MRIWQRRAIAGMVVGSSCGERLGDPQLEDQERRRRMRLVARHLSTVKFRSSTGRSSSRARTLLQAVKNRATSSQTSVPPERPSPVDPDQTDQLETLVDRRAVIPARSPFIRLTRSASTSGSKLRRAQGFVPPEPARLRASRAIRRPRPGSDRERARAWPECSGRRTPG